MEGDFRLAPSHFWRRKIALIFNVKKFKLRFEHF